MNGCVVIVAICTAFFKVGDVSGFVRNLTSSASRFGLRMTDRPEVHRSTVAELPDLFKYFHSKVRFYYL